MNSNCMSTKEEEKNQRTEGGNFCGAVKQDRCVYIRGAVLNKQKKYGFSIIDACKNISSNLK